MTSCQIRLITTMDEIAAVCRLQAETWGEEYVIPAFRLRIDLSNDGIIVGAFDENRRLLGFTYSFAAVRGERRFQYSNMTAIVPGLRARRLGEKLKQAQREEALRRGYDLITWTYDPLETVNANLNIRKLGAVAVTYHEDYYGEMPDNLNAGLPTDRLQVSWHIDRPPVRLEGQPLPALAAGTTRAGIWPFPRPVAALPTGPLVAVAVPANFQAIKKADHQLALEWRLAVRRAMQSLLDCGLALAGFDYRGKDSLWHQYLFVPREKIGYAVSGWD
ncbi:MAG: GNAT family N-acetyltransferase [Negativicutes bacterium]|nr:GNAT family N-acetyltransferase [Negativicutes bacterium]